MEIFLIISAIVVTSVGVAVTLVTITEGSHIETSSPAPVKLGRNLEPIRTNGLDRVELDYGYSYKHYRPLLSKEEYATIYTPKNDHITLRSYRGGDYLLHKSSIENINNVDAIEIFKTAYERLDVENKVKEANQRYLESKADAEQLAKESVLAELEILTSGESR